MVFEFVSILSYSLGTIYPILIFLGILVAGIGLVFLKTWSPYLVYLSLVFSSSRGMRWLYIPFITYLFPIRALGKLIPIVNFLTIGSLFFCQVIEFGSKRQSFNIQLENKWKIGMITAFVFWFADLSILYLTKFNTSYFFKYLIDITHILFDPLFWLLVSTKVYDVQTYNLYFNLVGAPIGFALIGLLEGRFLISKSNGSIKRFFALECVALCATVIFVFVLGYIVTYLFFSAVR
jgi:hypothetical protein